MNKNLKQIAIFLTLSVAVTICIAPVLVGAQGGGNPGAGGGNPPSQPSIITIGNPFKCEGSNCTLAGLLEAIINKILLPIGGIVAAIMIIYAGFLYVTAGGNETQIKKAHDALLYGVIGAAILLGAWVISNAIAATIRQLGGQV